MSSCSLIGDGQQLRMRSLRSFAVEEEVRIDRFRDCGVSPAM
jgi:hypothetical protein